MTVIINDINDEKPYFHPSRYKVNILQSLPIFSPVIQVYAYDKDLHSNLLFVIISGNANNTFQMNQTSGIITRTRTLNAFNDQFSYSLKVAASDGKHNTTTDVTINIIEERIGELHFSKSFYETQMSEETAVGRTVAQEIVAIDPKGGKLVYSIANSTNSSFFTIDKDTARIALRKQLDYELQDTYYITVTANNVFDYSRTDETLLVIYVTDANDETPIFYPNQANITIAENLLMNQIIYKVSASDQDSGRNGEIIFSVNGSPGPFSILESGVIILSQQLNVEADMNYVLEILATDQGIPSKTSVFILDITVADVNEFCPVFTNNISQYDIYENQSINTAVFQVLAKDNDKFYNDITYSILSADYFSINPNTGEVMLAKPLDYEAVQFVNVIVLASDNGNPPCRSTKSINITVKDINDNAPVFQKPFTYNILENSPIGFTVFEVNIRDADLRGVSSINFSISSNIATPFSINSTNGIVQVAKELDRKNKSQHRFQISVSDGKFFVSQIYSINILDPQETICSTSHFNFLAVENFPSTSNKTFGCLPQQTEVSKRYVITSFTGLNDFYIDEKGCLYFTNSPDFETRDEYYGKVLVFAEGELTDVSTFVVSVTNLNDNPPVFREKNISLFISEETSINTKITNILATDADSGSNAITYTIISGNTNDTFVLEERDLILVRDLNQTDVDSYLLKIRANDSRYYDEIAVKVTILKVRYAPVFKPNKYNVYLSENFTIGYPFLTVKAINIRQNGILKYGISNGNYFFIINKNNGSISLNRSLDYESKKSHSFTVFCYELEEPSIKGFGTVEITVLDINDNPPIFSERTKLVNVADEAAQGTVVTIVNAIDKDSLPNAQVNYSIMSNSINSFRINHFGEITLTRYFTINDPKIFNFSVEATDQGGLNDTIKIIVNQVRGNQPPVFERLVYVTNITENQPPTENILTATAKDGDTGDNGIIDYDLVSVYNSSHFKINPATGEISSLVTFDHEQKKEYIMMIQAKDRGYPSKTTSALVTIKIADIDEPPYFLEPLLHNLTVSENIPVNAVLLHLHYRDDDENQAVSFNTSGNTDAFIFEKRNEQTIAILLQEPLNYRNQSRYQIFMTLASYEKQSKTASVIIHVRPPAVFQRDSYEFSVNENFIGFIGSIELELRTDDSNFEYTMKPYNLSDTFVIDNDLNLNTTKPLDYENQTQYCFYIVAKKIDTQEVAITLVNVFVTDVDDVLPMTPIQHINLHIQEDLAPGSILKLIPLNFIKGIGYKLAPPQNSFQISLMSNVLYLSLSEKLDYENVTKFSFSVLVNVTTNQKLGLDIPVKISVLDVNDNNPRFTENSYKYNVSQNATIGYTLLQVSAMDLDDSVNSEIIYTILEADKNLPFQIDKRNGTITLVGSLQTSSISNYDLTIIAKDNGEPQLAASTTVKINVLPFNFHKPLFLRTNETNKSIHVKENTNVGLSLVKLDAKDDDFHFNILEYSIINGNTNSTFGIDENGVVSILKPLDFETVQNYSLKIAVMDNGIPKLKADRNANLEIVIVNENEHAPYFISTNYEIDLLENSSIGIEVMTVSAIDDDKGDNSTIRYSFQREEDYNLFHIENKTGKITLNSTLDHRVFQKYDLFVKASDMSFNEKYTFHKIQIHVLDVNSAPYFSETKYEIQVPEDTLPGYTLFKIAVNDEDTGLNANLSYSISGGNINNKFEIVDDKIILKNSLDFEEVKTYSLQIEVRDNPGLKANTTLIINVQNINQSSLFSHSFYEFYASENKNLADVIGVLSTKNNNSIIYQLTEILHEFKINSSGYLMLNESLDFETKTQYKFNVRGLIGNDYYEDVTVCVYVEDENDEAPFFTTDQYTVYLNSPVYNNTIIKKIEAIDKDGTAQNSQVSYKINSEVELPFQLDQDMLVATRDIELTNRKDYQLNIIANDNGKPEQFSEPLSLQVTILPTNNTVPRFVPSFYNVTVNENITETYRIAHVKVYDPDEGIYGITNISIEKSSDSEIFRVNQSGVLYLERSMRLNYTAQRKHIVVLKVTDSIGLHSIGVVVIHVSDKNNHVPIFNPSHYAVVIPDNMHVGEPITQVYATDNDVISGNKVNYRIVGITGQSVFNITPETGVIHLSHEIHPNAERNITLQIQAFNPSENNKSDEKNSLENATVDVHVLLSQPYIPIFQKSYYIFSVPENKPEDFIIGFVKAILNDKRVENTIVRYRIEEEFGDRDTFKINASNGAISLNKAVDREKKDQYTIIASTSTTFSSGENKAIIVINIEDINDNFPEPRNKSYTIRTSIEENLPPRSYVTEVQAHDEDLGNNSKIHYTLSNGEHTSYFTINENGVITTVNRINYAIHKNFFFTVTLSDSGSPRLSKEVNITIDIIDAPSFLTYYKTYDINETDEKHQELFNACNVSICNEAAMYEILGDVKSFKISNASGIVYTNTLFNFDEKREYQFTVKISNTKIQQNYSLIFATVRILNVNRYEPVFQTLIENLEMTSSLDFGVKNVVTKLTATDDDKTDVISYSLNGDATDIFGIDSLGQVYVKKKFTINQTTSYFLMAYAEDNGTPSRTSTNPVSLSIKVNYIDNQISDTTETTDEEKAVITIDPTEIFKDPTRFESFDVELQSDFKEDIDCKYFIPFPIIIF